jgi:hypothetical protein
VRTTRPIGFRAFLDLAAAVASFDVIETFTCVVSRRLVPFFDQLLAVFFRSSQRFSDFPIIICTHSSILQSATLLATIFSIKRSAIKSVLSTGHFHR